MLIFLSGCSEQQTVNYNDTYKKDGLIYLKFSEPTPYTGNVTGKMKGFIKNGKKHGKFLQFYSSGELLKRANYKNGLRHGEYLTYCNNGDIQNEEYFESDFPVGTQNFFTCKYDSLKHYKHQSIKYYKKKDSNQREIFYAFRKDYNSVNGQVSESFLYKSKSKQGNIWSSKYRSNWDILEWKIYKYHTNNNLKSLGEYKIFRSIKKMKHGTFIWYDEDGNEIKKKYYTNDELTTSPPQ